VFTYIIFLTLRIFSLLVLAGLTWWRLHQASPGRRR